MKLKIILNILILIAFSCSYLQAQKVEKLSPSRFEEDLKNQKDYQLVDVRTNTEYKEGHITDALNMDFNSKEFKNLIAQLDKNKPTYVYCLSGGRSTAAIKIMEEKGFKNLYELDGGMKKWKEEGKPFETITAKKEGITKKDYSKLITDERLVLVDFGAKWCGPCRKMDPTIKKLSLDKELDIKVVKIDVDQNEQLSQELNIEALPTLHLYKNQKLVWQQEGYMTEEQIRAALSKHSN